MRNNQLGKGWKDYHSMQNNIPPFFVLTVFGDQHRYFYAGNVSSSGTSLRQHKRWVTVDVNQSWQCWSPSPVIGFEVGVRLYSGREEHKQILRLWCNKHAMYGYVWLNRKIQKDASLMNLLCHWTALKSAARLHLIWDK